VKSSNELLSTLDKVLSEAKKFGANEADAIIFDSTDLALTRRMGEIENVVRSESNDLGLRVLIKSKDGFKQALVSSNDISDKSISEMAERAVSMAKITPADPFISLAPSELIVKNQGRDLELADTKEASPELLEKWAEEAEEAALSVVGITNSDGAAAGYDRNIIALATTNGFASAYETTTFSVSVSVIAGEGLGMETDYDYANSRFLSDLTSPALIGKSAAEITIRRLNPRKVKSGSFPVVFDKRVAKSLLGSFSGAINGAAVARGTSFLKDKMNSPVFGKNINIIDDPFRKRGLGTEPFDGEGVAAVKMNVVENGILRTWFLDMRSANKLGLKTTGHAGRDTSSPPSPGSSNLYLEAGKLSVAEIIKDIKSGFYVMDTFGMGINGVTGDYSQGASGYWIENGEIAYPVSEVTIASNLKDMFLNLTPANDLEFKSSINCPTVRIESMTVAGE
jgi:PmbA protein